MRKQYKKNIIFILLYLLIVSGAAAQHQNILISDMFEPNEPSICINPKNTSQMVAGANLDNVYLSSDGGLTWTGGTLTSYSYGVWGDPCIIADTAGAFYYFHLSNPQFGNWIDRIICQKMSAFGGAWSDGSYMGLNGAKAQDKEWAVVNPKNNHIYATWTQFDDYGSASPADSSVILFSKSADNGLSWSAPVRLSRRAGDCIDSDNTVEGAVPCVGPNGEIYTSWAGPVGLMFDRSLDGGNTWLGADIHVSDMPGGWDISIPGIYRCNGMPVTCCDISNGPYRGNIYINWSDQRNGTTDTDIWLVKSIDGGNTWSLPKRVNNDPPGRQQFFTWMAVDQVTGYLWIVFYDRRNYSNNNTDVYMAVSTDGGDSFINFKVSQSQFNPDASVFFGDYTNISAHNNVIRPIWVRLQNTDLGVYTALVNPSFLGDNEPEEEAISLDEPYPNPSSGKTMFCYKLRRPGRVFLKVNDVLGREVARLADNEYRPAGRYHIDFDPIARGLGQGVYTFLLKSEQLVKAKTFVLIPD